MEKKSLSEVLCAAQIITAVALDRDHSSEVLPESGIVHALCQSVHPQAPSGDFLMATECWHLLCVET